MLFARTNPYLLFLEFFSTAEFEFFKLVVLLRIPKFSGSESSSLKGSRISARLGPRACRDRRREPRHDVPIVPRGRSLGVIHIPDAEWLKKAGFGAYADVPVMFTGAHRYLRELNRYLRERAVMDWHPSQILGEPNVLFGSRAKQPCSSSLKTMSARLDNFFEWTEWAGLDWKTLDYGYQADMLTGRWSVSGEALKPSTVNQRVSDACNFLRWAAFRGLRSPFNMKLVCMPSAPQHFRRTAGHPKGPVMSRVGSVRADPGDLRLPTAHEIATWLKAVESRFGFVKGLCAARSCERLYGVRKLYNGNAAISPKTLASGI